MGRSKKTASGTNSKVRGRDGSAADGAGGDFLARLLSSLPTHLVPSSATPLSDKHPICRWLLNNEPSHNSNNSKSGTSHSHHSLPPQPMELTTTASSSLLAAATAVDPSSPHHSNKTSNNNNNNSTETSTNTAATYWLVLATYCLQQLLPLPQQQQKPNDDEVTSVAIAAQVVAWLCHGIAQVVPRNKLDASVATKQIVGRALLVVSLGASQALSILTSPSSSPKYTAAITACIVALDRATLAIQPHAASAVVTPSDAYWNSLQWEPMLQPSPDFLDSLRQFVMPQRDWAAADACWRALTAAAVPPLEDNSSSSNHVLETFQQLLKGQSTTFSEGRLALKRWSSIALTWYSGQEQMLWAALHLLMQNEQHWPDGGVVVCQAVVPAEDQSLHKVSSGALPSKKEKKGTAATSVTPSTTTAPVAVDIPSNVAKLALVGRLCRVVRDTSAAAGSRPPTGELDAFLKSLTSGTTTTVKKGQRLQRSDVRDLVMVIVYQWIRQHEACLRENFETSSSASKMVINEEEADAVRQGRQGSSSSSKRTDVIRRGTISSSSSSLESLYYYYPFVHQALEDMAIVASSNAAGSTSLVQCRDRIEFAAAAFVMQAQHEAAAAEQTYCPLDAKLTRFSIAKLVACLSLSSNGSRTTSHNNPMADSVLSMVTAAATSASSTEAMNSRARRPTTAASDHKYIRPLPVPSFMPSTAKPAATHKRKVASAAPVLHCSFAGVYNDPSAKGGSNTNNDGNGEFTADDKLQLFLQSVHGSKNNDDESAPDPIDSTAASSQLYSHLLWILETCLDTRESLSEDSATPPEGNKRKANTTTMTRSNKRRKRVGRGGAKKNNDSDDPGGEPMISDRGYQPIKGMRGTVAVETMSVLGLFLRDPVVNTSLTAMQATLRRSVTMEQMNRLLALGPVLYQVIVKSHLRALVREADGSQSASTVLDEADRYSDQEQSLWTKHKDLLITLGRGREEFDEQMRITPIFGGLRLELYKRVAELSKRQSPKGWPLSLNPVHHFFLASSLTAEPIVSVSEIVGREADIFIVDGFVTELECALKELGSLEMTTTTGSLSVSEDIAVTWNDARIFLAAFARLTHEEQSSTFSSLLIPVDRVFTRLTDATDKQKNGSVLACRGVSSFLARLVTLCVNSYVMMSFGSGARDELFRALGKYISDHMPATSASEEWFTADNAFLGIFTDWSDQQLPAIPVPTSFPKRQEGVTMLQHLLESAFAVGFVTAKEDRCHLLFAAWNALGKNDLWNTNQHGVQMVTTLPRRLSTLLLQLREDAAFVNRLALRATCSFHPTSTLLKAIDQMDTVIKGYSLQSLQSEAKLQLRIMIKKASKLVDLLLQKFMPSDDLMQQEALPEFFCLLEACAAYISFAISTCTRPNSDLFSSIMLAMTERAMRNRDRGYSSDSGDNHSDGGSEESNDVLIDTMERMQDVCDCIGAAPAHPDWLDKDSRLWEGLSAEDASQAALEAQACLTKLLSVGLMRSRLAHQLALQNFLGEGQESVARLASNLWWLRNFSPKQSGVGVYSSGERKYITDIGAVCGLDAKTSGIVLADPVVGFRHAATESWQGHSAQRILGRYQEPFRNGLAGEVETAELRASGEWEVLLAGALTAASIFVKFSVQGAVVDEDVCSKLTCCGLWSGVCRSSIDALVPAVALLRFCICSGGRIAHPLSSVDASIASFDSKKVFSKDDIPDGVSTSRSTIDAVILTIGTLAMYPSLTTCDLVATNLLVDSSQFDSLRGMEASSLALQVLGDLLALFEAKVPGCCEASPFVLERIADILILCSTFQRDDGRRIPSSILGSLRHESGLPFVRLNLFVTKENIEPSLALARAHSFTSSTGYSSLTNWSWEQPRKHFLQYLLSPFWKKSLGANARTLTFFANCLSSMIVMECNETSAGSSTLQSLLLPLAVCLNQLSDDTLARIIQNFVCNNSYGGTENQPPECIQASLCTIIAFVVALKDNGCTVFTRSGLILSTLQGAYDEWKTFPIHQRELIIDLMLLIAFQRNKVFQLGEGILEDLKTQLQIKAEVGHSSFENAKHFTDGVLAMKSALSKKAVSMPISNQSSSKSILSSLPDKCTFDSVRDFHDQHWYNCYSCGLTSDKGCCSLCAVVCHQGHDVEYARYSSFFCDCGGEESHGSPAKCRCLATHSRDKFLKNQCIVTSREAPAGGQSISGSLLLSSELCADILKSSFAQEGQKAISELLGKGQKAAWTRFMLKCTNQQFDGWKSHRGIVLAKNCITDSYGALSNLLCERTVSTTVGRLKIAKLILLGASNTGMIQTKMSVDSATNRVKRTRLSGIGIFRSVLDADSRGRLVCAEPRGLVFCSGFSVARYLSNSSATSFSRSAMRNTCTVETGVHAVGVKFAQDNENRVLVWGIDDSKIVLMNENLTSAISVTALDCGAGRAELDNIIVNAHWLHGSGTGVILGFRRSLLLFNMSKADDKSMYPVAYTISTEACNSAMRDFAIVPFTKANVKWKGNVSSWYVYVLMDNGTVYSTRVRQTSGGDYDADDIDPLNPLHFQLKENDHSTHSSPQEGFSLTYLDQSNLLLYQASNSAVVAIRLDEWSGSKSSFDLLPYDLSTEPKTDVDDILTGRGPYTHWKQLGSVSYGSTNAFRLSCCAQPSGEGEPLLLCVEFNQNETRVQEFTRTATGWFDPPQSCEGVALFSAPFLGNDTTLSKSCSGKQFGERLLLCTLSLNGCLHIYAETVVSQARTALAPARDLVTVDGQTHMLVGAVLKDPPSGLLKFEKLKNLTDSKNLTFQSDSLGSSEMIRDKLLIANGESFLVSSWCDGFTLSISYRENNCHFSSLTKAPLEGIVISALRISVGAYSIENIPQSFRIMGRVVPLKPGQKRWYSIHLSEEEIALSVRNGFVTVDVDQCFDSSNKPVLDAMEVYGLTRKDIELWFPLYLRQCAASFPFAGSDSAGPIIPINLEQNQFRLCLMTLTNLHSLLGTYKPKIEEETFVRQLVQDTALETDSGIKLCVASLVASLKPNDDTRQSFLDMAVLSGCSAFLKECHLQLNEWESCNLHAHVLGLWHSITPSLRNCLQTAAGIAKHRPFNYLQVAEERPQAFESIAADACELAHKYLTKSLGNDTLVSDLVELSLLEVAIINGRRLGRFGSFCSLQNFISSESKIVVGQACSAMAVFCRDSDIFHTLTKAVQYVCDSCFAVISDTRYTSLDDAQPFDLCPKCYRLGTEFITVKNPADATNVIIKGQSVGEDHKLTCGAVKSMQAVVIRNEATESGQNTQALPGIIEGTVQSKAPLSAQQQLFNDFMDILISGVSEHMGDWLAKPDYVPDSMVWLSVEFVRHSFQSGRKLNKARKLATALAAGLSCRLKNSSAGGATNSQCVLFMEGLISLVLPNQSARDYLIGARPYVTMENQPSPSTRDSICCNHGASLKGLRFTDGVDTNRLFLGCPLDKKDSCKFFAWADEPTWRNESNQLSGSIFLKDGAKFVWQLLTESHGDEEPLNLLLASFIQSFSCKKLKESKISADELGYSEICDYSFDRDFADGVFCSHLRLKNDSYEQRMCFLNHQYREQETGQTELSISFKAVEKSLYLLALTAVPGDNSHSKWFPILCQITMHRNSWGSVLPILARASLHRLCGALWSQVRDFYNFTFKFEELIESGRSVFRYFVLLNEKARQCSPSWKSSTLQRFSCLNIGDFAGTEFLMSEDVSTLHLNDSLSKVLSDLWASANKRGSSWRRFCSLQSLHQLQSVSRLDFVDPLDLFEASPLLVLFSLSFSLSAENQIKLLQLIHLALVPSNDQKSQKPLAVDKSNSSDDDDIKAAPEHPNLFGFLGAQGTSAADTAGASIDDLYAFVMCLVYRGNTSEIRSLASKVAIRLCYSLPKEDMGNLVRRFMQSPLYKCGTYGKHSSDFLSFLHLLVKLTGPSAVDVPILTTEVQSCFKQQILALRHDRLNKDCVHFETRSNAFVQKKKYDLCSCVSCCLQIPRVKEKLTKRAPSMINAGNGETQGSNHMSSRGVSKLKWAPEQVSPFVRCRLHASRESFASNEFSVFYSLKNRSVISEIHVEVENPRRHVKTIKFYFAPKPVEDPSILKAETFVKNWQPCGTLNLSRGSTRATLAVSPPVVAANLKIEYADFFDAGASRSSDGTLVVLCPRCTRAVTNAHGVCSNCGEVAFQCRKCRHINYDRLDAFLCVECGYCASASFQFELTAGVASNAVAIMNDAKYNEMVKMSSLASQLRSDLRLALKEKLAALVQGKNKKGVANGAESERALGIDAVRRAFTASGPAQLGRESEESLDYSKLTANQLVKTGSMVKIVAHPGSRGEISLYRLARRAQRSSEGRGENVMIQGFHVEDETASELLGGLLDGPGGLARLAGLDAGDPLSQLLASVHSRRERREVDEHGQALTGELGISGNNKKSTHASKTKEAVEECDRLFDLMREAEREAYMLECRCIAWSRLNSGRLIDLDIEQREPFNFEPSHCSSCAATIAVQLLVLWLHFFQLDPDAVVIDQEMIALLLHDVATGHLRNLQETRKAIVKDIAIYSKQGRLLVVDALRARLILTHDVNSAEILDKILESIGGDAEAAAPFVVLAQEALEHNSNI